MTDTRKWSWWATSIETAEDQPESYDINETTREAALAKARQEHGAGAIIRLIEATQDGPFKNRPFDEHGDCPLLEAIFDKWLGVNSERWGEDGDGPPLGDVADDIARRLNDAFEAAIAAHHDTLMEGVWAFTETRNAEVVKPEADHG